MRRICLSHPFVHGTTGCWGRSKIVPNFWEQKIPAAFSILLYHHFQLQSECLGGLVLDQFDAPNPPVVSICPWDDWLLRYKQNRAQFLRAKNSGSFFHPPLPPLSTTIRMPWRVGFRPIWRAEYACSIHLSVGLLVVDVQAKSGPLSESEKFRQLFSSSSTTTFNYSQNALEGWF